MGGFAAGPVVLLAAFLGIPSAIGEQNAVAGRTNRLLGRFVKRVFISFPESAVAFPPQKVRMTGNPVRPELLSAARESEPPIWRTSQEEALRILIFGGSQGALGINKGMLDVVPKLRDLPFPLEVKHQSGATLIEELEEAYSAAGISHQVVPFIEEMDKAYQWAHMVVCRAGATSLAELALFRRPSVLVPYPFATDDHQRRNAQAFEKTGAAFIAEGGEQFVARLEGILRDIGDDPEILGKMGKNAGRLARPKAAAEVADECLALAQGGQRITLGATRSPRNG
jgi:UDP-N-acetylglucosamine--N-acetylmuramyl-(pentapeptide) pyrophosphoryl-undecaprenol N-acetylglucosamine transferase